VLMRTFIPATVIALVCSATPLLAQTTPPAAVQTPAPSQTPVPPVPGAQPPATQTPGVQTPVAPAVQAPTAPTSTVQTPTAQTPAVDTDHGTAIVLLDRIQKLLDDAVAKGGPITLDRGLVDEMRAEVTQVKISLQGERAVSQRIAR
jgi:hypothetical protein